MRWQISVFARMRRVSSRVTGTQNWVNKHYLDTAFSAMVGGNWSLEPDYWRAHTQATALEGELYVITDGGPTNRIMSMASLFGPGSSVFGR